MLRQHICLYTQCGSSCWWFYFSHLYFSMLLHKVFVNLDVFCFENILECSNIQFMKLPEFAEVVRLSTQKLILRNMDNLDLSSFKIGEWINLKEIDLTGKIFIYFNKILCDYLTLVIVPFLKKIILFSGSQKGCDTLKDAGNTKVYGCERKTTVHPFPLKLPTVRGPRLIFRRDDNQTDSNSTTTVTPEESVAQQDTIKITLSIGKIIFSAYNFFG